MPSNKKTKILAIETSCDETAIALISARGGARGPQFKILGNLVASQIKIHRPFGGVVPNLAKREHLKNLPVLFKNLQLTTHNLQPDIIAVTVGPGLEPCLWTGINFAKELYKNLKLTINNPQLKLIGTSHLEGHLYSFLLNPKNKIQFPALALIVSGGHTILILMKDLTHLKKLGETRDDAVGECFDKVARLLKLPYPGGPEIEKIAKKGDMEAINFPRPMLSQKNYDFSFSGLKTSVLYYLRDLKTQEVRVADISASFQKAAFDVLIKKTLRATKEFKAKSIIVAGGVAANKTLAKMFKKAIQKDNLRLNLIIPEMKFCTDNASMIAVSAYLNFLQNKKYKLVANSGLNFK